MMKLFPDANAVLKVADILKGEKYLLKKVIIL